MSFLAHLRVWLASIRYSATRAMMFRFDFLLWLAVDSAWMVVQLLFIEVLFSHINQLAGWTKPEMILLAGTTMLIMRLFFAFFFSNLIQVDRHLREGTMDFYLAQPGNPLFMIATRKIEFDSLLNALLAVGVVMYAVHTIGLHPDLWQIITYICLIGCGLVVHFSVMTLLVSLGFWMQRSQGVEGGYFGLFDVSRLPRSALKRIMEVIFVWTLPAAVVSNVPTDILRVGLNPVQVAWLVGVTVIWFTLATSVFRLGLRRYSSASS